MPKDGTRGIQANSFYYRTIKNWNELPRNVVNATTINSFKKQLDDAWEDKPFKYDPKTIERFLEIPRYLELVFHDYYIIGEIVFFVQN